MNANFARALELVLAHEGGYVDHPADPGGATNLGITIGTARRLNIDVDGDGDTDKVDIRKLTKADAAKVYRAEYWDKVRGDDLPSGLDYAVFDFAVNSGVSRAAKYLQAILRVPQDGKIGPVTIAAAKAADATILIERLCANRLEFLKGLSTFKTFGRGWTSRVEGVIEHALLMTLSPAPPAPDYEHFPEPPSTIPVSDEHEAKPKGSGLTAIILIFILALALAAYFLTR